VSRKTWVLFLSTLGALGGAASCGKSESDRQSNGDNGGSSSVGGSVSGGSSGGGGASGSANGGTSNGGSGGDAGDGSVTGGTSGSGPGGEGGAGGAGDGGSGGAPDECEAATFQGDVTASSDAELAVLEGITRLEGDLVLRASVSNVRALTCLTSITGNLNLAATTLTDLELDALASIGGAITLRENATLTRVSFPNLTSLGVDAGSSLTLEYLSSLAALHVPRLAQTPAGLRLAELGWQTDEALVLRFDRLETVGGTLQLDHVANLQSVDGFPRLAAIQGNLWVTGNGSLETLDGLAGLQTVDGSVDVGGNLMLRSVDLASLTTLGPSGAVSFSNLGALESLDLRSLVEIPGSFRFSVVSSSKGAPLALDFRSLETVGASMELYTVFNLENLDAFQSLATIGGELRISQSEIVRANLPNLESVVAPVSIIYNPLLRSIELGSLTTMLPDPSAAYALELDRLPRLDSVDLRALTQVPGAFSLHNSGEEAAAPLTLNATALTTIGDASLSLAFVSNLHDLSGFSALRFVTGGLSVYMNASLTNLHGLEELTELEGDLAVFSNAALPTCEARWLEDQLQMSGWSGMATISGNLSDTCN